MTNKYTRVKVSDLLFMLAMVTVLAFPGPSRLKVISIIAFFGYMMAIKVMHYRHIKNDLHIIGSFLFLGYAYLSKQWAVYPEGVSEQINNVLWTVLLSTAISTYVIYRDLSVKDIANRLVPIALLFCVNVLVNGSYQDSRLSIGINANTFGNISSGIACFLIYQGKQNKWKSGFQNILIVVFALFVFLSGSRKALLMLMMYVVAFLMFEHYTKDGAKILGKVLSILIIAAIVYFCIIKIEKFYDAIGRRVEALLYAIVGLTEGDGSFITRMRMMETAKTIFLQHPLIGIGLNNFKFATYHNTYAHSNCYELAACLGVVGLAIYYVPLVFYLKRSLSQWKKGVPQIIVPLAIIVAFAISDIGSVTYFSVIGHTFLCLAIGLVSKNNYVKQ